MTEVLAFEGSQAQTVIKLNTKLGCGFSSIKEISDGETQYLIACSNPNLKGMYPFKVCVLHALMYQAAGGGDEDRQFVCPAGKNPLAVLVRIQSR